MDSDPERSSTPPLADLDGLTLAERLDYLLVRLDALRDNPRRTLLVATALIGLAVAGWWVGRPDSVTPVEARIPLATTAPPTTGPEPEQPDTVLVHVAGAVRQPGIVSLDAGSRIADAVDAAGGPTSDADVHRLNLAAPVTDGLHIRVPVDGEVVSPVGESPVAGPGDNSDSSAPVNLNTASETDLETLPGIGPALAAAIVKWRAENGPFASVDGLLAVPGIGPAKLAQLVERASV